MSCGAPSSIVSRLASAFSMTAASSALRCRSASRASARSSSIFSLPYRRPLLRQPSASFRAERISSSDIFYPPHVFVSAILIRALPEEDIRLVVDDRGHLMEVATCAALLGNVHVGHIDSEVHTSSISCTPNLTLVEIFSSTSYPLRALSSACIK